MSIKLKSLLAEGVEFAAKTTSSAKVKYNKKPTGGSVGAIQWAEQGYAEVPKDTFLIGLPGGLFAVNIRKKFAMALTGNTRTWLGSQDKLGGKVKQISISQAPQFSEWRHLLGR